MLVIHVALESQFRLSFAGSTSTYLMAFWSVFKYSIYFCCLHFLFTCLSVGNKRAPFIDSNDAFMHMCVFIVMGFFNVRNLKLCWSFRTHDFFICCISLRVHALYSTSLLILSMHYIHTLLICHYLYLLLQEFSVAAGRQDSWHNAPIFGAPLKKLLTTNRIACFFRFFSVWTTCRSGDKITSNIASPRIGWWISLN
jgi:hypothetical protein